VTDSDNKTRASRDSETHDKQARRRPWRPVRKLETPPAPPGYTYRWIRESMLGQEDRANVSRRIREGWELVKASDLPPEWELPTMDAGKHAGVIYNEGLLLAKIPDETVEERNAYYNAKNQAATDALDNTMFNETRGDRRYVKYDPQRDSQVTFGRR
jgi:hypothetical protein